MPNLKEVRGRIQSVISTQQITKAMKMVAAAKLRRAQDKIIGMRPYAKKLEEILSNLSSGDIQNEYGESREMKNVVVVVITSDRGLCGGFNSSVNKAAFTLINGKYANYLNSGNLKVVCIGKKSADFFSRRIPKDILITDYVNLFLDLKFKEVKKAAEYLMAAFTKKDIDQVDIVYNEFKNVATQVVCTQQFLPTSLEERASEIESTVSSNDYIFEPSKDGIVSELIPKSLKVQFYSALLESNAGEQGARMTAMEKATENAGDLLKELKLSYNRSRQAAITNEILEIVAGAEALSSN